MKTVYIVTTGSYSDYAIDSVWDRYEDAKQVSDRFGDSYVEEYVLNSMSRPAKPVWGASLGVNGFRLDDKATAPSDVGNVSTEVWHNRLTGQVFGRAFDIDPKRAEKKLYDAIAEYKAKLNNL